MTRCVRLRQLLHRQRRQLSCRSCPGLRYTQSCPLATKLPRSCCKVPATGQGSELSTPAGSQKACPIGVGANLPGDGHKEIVYRGCALRCPLHDYVRNRAEITCQLAAGPIHGLRIDGCGDGTGLRFGLHGRLMRGRCGRRNGLGLGGTRCHRGGGAHMRPQSPDQYLDIRFPARMRQLHRVAVGQLFKVGRKIFGARHLRPSHQHRHHRDIAAQR